MPPYTPDLLQLLDVSLFMSLKGKWTIIFLTRLCKITPNKIRIFNNQMQTINLKEIKRKTFCYFPTTIAHVPFFLLTKKSVGFLFPFCSQDKYEGTSLQEYLKVGSFRVKSTKKHN